LISFGRVVVGRKLSVSSVVERVKASFYGDRVITIACDRVITIA